MSGRSAVETRSAPSRRRRTRPGDLADHTTAVSAADRDLTVTPGPSPPGVASTGVV